MDNIKEELAGVAKGFYERGWSLATSSNFSAVYGDSGVLITVSGKDKGALSKDDFILIDRKGNALETEKGRSSAETELHLYIYQNYPDTKSVLHTHSKYATAISMVKKKHVKFMGFEMQKAFPEIKTHLEEVKIPIFENSQDMKDIQKQLNNYKDKKNLFACIIRGHGVYAWGRSIAEAKKIIEAIEFLLECNFILLNSKKGG